MIAMKQILQANIEVLDQALDFLNQIDNTLYIYEAKPIIDSTIGQHLRHVSDMYSAVLSALSTSDALLIDYEKKTRGNILEHCRQSAIAKFNSYKSAIAHIDLAVLEHPVSIFAETTCLESHAIHCPSTIARELFFVSSHAIHHFAMMKSIARIAHQPVNKNFGLAPSTVKFFRAAT